MIIDLLSSCWGLDAGVQWMGHRGNASKVPPGVNRVRYEQRLAPVCLMELSRGYSNMWYFAEKVPSTGLGLL